MHEDEDEEAVMHSDVDARAAAWLRESPFRGGAQAAADAAVRVAAKAAHGAVGPSLYPLSTQIVHIYYPLSTANSTTSAILEQCLSTN